MAEIIWEKYREKKQILTLQGLCNLLHDHLPINPITGEPWQKHKHYWRNPYDILMMMRDYSADGSLDITFFDNVSRRRDKGFHKLNNDILKFEPTIAEELFYKYCINGISIEGLYDWFRDENITQTPSGKPLDTMQKVGKFGMRYYKNPTNHPYFESLNLDEFTKLYDDIYSHSHAISKLVLSDKTNVFVGKYLNNFLPNASASTAVLDDAIFKNYAKGKTRKERGRKSRRRKSKVLTN